jgi:hypothetical protein
MDSDENMENAVDATDDKPDESDDKDVLDVDVTAAVNTNVDTNTNTNVDISSSSTNTIKPKETKETKEAKDSKFAGLQIDTEMSADNNMINNALPTTDSQVESLLENRVDSPTISQQQPSTGKSENYSSGTQSAGSKNSGTVVGSVEKSNVKATLSTRFAEEVDVVKVSKKSSEVGGGILQDVFSPDLKTSLPLSKEFGKAANKKGKVLRSAKTSGDLSSAAHGGGGHSGGSALAGLTGQIHNTDSNSHNSPPRSKVAFLSQGSMLTGGVGLGGSGSAGSSPEAKISPKNKDGPKSLMSSPVARIRKMISSVVGGSGVKKAATVSPGHGMLLVKG